MVLHDLDHHACAVPFGWVVACLVLHQYSVSAFEGGEALGVMVLAQGVLVLAQGLALLECCLPRVLGGTVLGWLLKSCWEGR